jgi:hypothetical protein
MKGHADNMYMKKEYKCFYIMLNGTFKIYFILNLNHGVRILWLKET